MFGVLWANLNGGYSPTEPKTGLDHALQWAQEWLIDSRFYSLLILLFGIGFGIQLTRAGAAGQDIRATYYRRSLALLVIGVVHGTLIWRGDILTIYALVSFALVMFRNATPKQLLLAVFLCWFVGPLVVREAMYLTGLRVMVPGSAGEMDFVYARGTWLQIEAARVGGYLQWLGRWALPSFVGILGAFLLGLWTVKTGWLRRIVEEPKVTRRVALAAFLLSLLGYANWIWAGTLWPRFQPPQVFVDSFPYLYFQLNQLRAFLLRFTDWASEGPAVLYATLLILAWQRPLGKRLLRPMAAAGRMALTTYLTQSVVCTLLFYSYGLGWYGTFSYTGFLILALVLFALQMAASTWWLARYRYGPAEWLWRTLTYGRPPEMKLARG